MEQNGKDMTALIKENFAQMLDPDFGLTDMTLPAMEGLIETALLKVMANVFSTINEKQNPDFFVNMGIKMLEIANEHFSKINEIMEKENKSLAYEVNPAVMLQRFDGLHPAIARNPNLDPKNSRSYYMNAFSLL